MSASPSPASALESSGRAVRAERYERIFQALPPLGSPEYLRFLATATATELPASVLVRAYHQLYPSPAADATLERLLGHNDRYGYITALYIEARRRLSRLDAYGPEDLVADTIGEIIATIAGPGGKMGEGAWSFYLLRCMEVAYRKLVPRRRGWLTQRVDAPDDDDMMEAAASGRIPWQGCVAPSNLEWLEEFVERAAAEITHENIREVARDLFSHSPMPISSDDPNDPNTLTGRFGVKRFSIYRWREAARAALRAALERQNECDIDMSFLEFTD